LRHLNEGKEKVAKMIKHRMPEGYEIYGV
jgi:hypothetical protein